MERGILSRQHTDRHGLVGRHGAHLGRTHGAAGTVFPHQPHACRSRQPGMVFTALINRAGTRVLTAADDGTAKLWNAETGDTVAVLPHEDDGGRRALQSRRRPGADVLRRSHRPVLGDPVRPRHCDPRPRFSGGRRRLLAGRTADRHRCARRNAESLGRRAWAAAPGSSVTKRRSTRCALRPAAIGSRAPHPMARSALGGARRHAQTTRPRRVAAGTVRRLPRQRGRRGRSDSASHREIVRPLGAQTPGARAGTLAAQNRSLGVWRSRSSRTISPFSAVTIDGYIRPAARHGSGRRLRRGAAAVRVGPTTEGARIQ